MTAGADEQVLIKLATEGDAEAIGSLYELYADRIYRFALLRLGDHTDAEDVTEQVFVKMIERISSFSWTGPRSFTAWLYRIAFNQSMDSLRLQTRRPQVRLDTVQEYMVEEASDPQKLAERQDFLSELVGCMGELSELEVQVILLKYGAELSRAEVAESLDCSQETVGVIQHRALKKLRVLMKLKGYETHRG